MGQRTQSSWFYLKDGRQLGPVSGAALKVLAESGQIRPDFKIWREGLPEWVEARRVRGLFPEAAAGPTEIVVASPMPVVATPSPNTLKGSGAMRFGRRTTAWLLSGAIVLFSAGTGGLIIWRHHETQNRTTALAPSGAQEPPEVKTGSETQPQVGASDKPVISVPLHAGTSATRFSEPPARMDEAKAWLKMAYDDASKADPDDATDHMDLLSFVGGAQANAGDTVGAIKTAELLIDRAAHARSHKVAGFDRIGAISILINVGSTARARALLDAFANEVVQRLKPATDKTLLPYDDFDPQWTVGAIAVQRARLGDSDAANAFILKLPNTDDRAICNCRLAEVLFALKKPKEARQALLLAKQETESPDSKADIAVAHMTYEVLMGAGEFDDARQVRCLEEYINGIVFELVQALWHLRESGPHDTAVAVIQSMCAEIEKLPDADFKSADNYLDLARAQAFDAGDFQAALRTMRRAEPRIAKMEPGDRKEMLIKAAAVYARAGEDRSFRESLAAAEQISEMARRYGSQELTKEKIEFAFFEVAEALAAIGKFDEAIEMARKCPATIIKYRIAREMARAGLLDRAIDLAREQRLRLEELRPFVWACTSAGHDLAPLKRCALEIKDPERRGTVELAAAEGLMNKRDSISHISPPW
jgi:tetratricopeptide (TPR) repeat protein